MVMIEPSQLTFGLIAKIGHQDHNAKTETLIATTNLHQEEVRQERKGEKEVMNDLKFHESFVWKCFVVLATNLKIESMLIHPRTWGIETIKKIK
jgi:hypothetical protein